MTWPSSVSLQAADRSASDQNDCAAPLACAPTQAAAVRWTALAAHCRYSTTKRAPSKALASRRSAGSQKQCCSKTQLRSCSDARQHAQRPPLLENFSSKGDLLFACQEYGGPSRQGDYHIIFSPAGRAPPLVDDSIYTLQTPRLSYVVVYGLARAVWSGLCTG